MATETWLTILSVCLFAMFVGEMISVYNFLINIPEDDGFLRAFSADAKILQFISIGIAPAGILAGIAFIMSKHYGSKRIGGMIIVGGIFTNFVYGAVCSCNGCWGLFDEAKKKAT